jgi:hypothetical protein
MSRSIESILIALALLSFTGCGDRSLEVEIRYAGPAAVPVTPDSTSADPLLASDTRFFSFDLAVKTRATLEPGGGIRIEQGHLFMERPLMGTDVRYTFPDVEIEDRSAANFLSVNVEGVPHQLECTPVGLGRLAPTVIFPEGLPAGREVLFRFGDTSGGGPGLACPTWPVKVRFLVLLDREGQGEYTLAKGPHPEVEARASGADRFQVTGPSITHDASIVLKIVPIRGKSGWRSSALPVKDFSGKVKVYSNENLLAETSFHEGDRFQRVKVELPNRGLHRLRAVCRDLEGVSQPILFSDGDQRLFWGSLQNHTAVGGHAASVPEEAYRCARDEGALDFCAVTDHSSNGSFIWEELREIPDTFDEPGRFTAFAGYEWTSSLWGHRHIVFKEGQGTLACSELPTEDPHSVYAPDLEALAAQVGRDPNAIIVVHHARRVLDPQVERYAFGDPEALPRQRLFEVFSWQGSSEGAKDDLPITGLADRTHQKGSGFRDALRLGYRLGVTADSDSHMGLPGIAVGIKRRMGMRYGMSGLTAAFADSLDRPGIFSALEDRRCYGTTGARILILFTLEGAVMGETVDVAAESVRIDLRIHGTAPLALFQIIADGNVVVHEERPASLDVERSFSVPRAASSYYLRVLQEDDHMAWTSPVWVRHQKRPGG